MACIIMLPVGLTGIRSLYQWLLIRRSHQYIQQLLPAACLGLSESDLGDGFAKMQTIAARTMLTQRFQEHLPPLLQGRLSLQQVQFQTRRLTYDPDHWMGDRQPGTQPIVTIHALLTDPASGRSIVIRHALELFVD
jgi:hypothetical protein